MAKYTYTNHSITSSTKLKDQLVLAGDIIPKFGINIDVYIESELPKSTIDGVIVAAGD